MSGRGNGMENIYIYIFLVEKKIETKEIIIYRLNYCFHPWHEVRFLFLNFEKFVFRS